MRNGFWNSNQNRQSLKTKEIVAPTLTSILKKQFKNKRKKDFRNSNKNRKAIKTKRDSRSHTNLKIKKRKSHFRNSNQFDSYAIWFRASDLYFSWEIVGLLMQSDRAKSEGTKSDLRIRWPKSSDFGPNSDDSAHGIIKSKNGHRSIIKLKADWAEPGIHGSLKADWAEPGIHSSSTRYIEQQYE